MLYEVVKENLETLLEQGRQRSESLLGYPAFIEHEFLRYLSCGDLSRGMARARCPECGYERLVPPSCKGRFCPSCTASRAADIAAHLVDRVLPEARYRQFVLTFPWEIHLLLSVDRQFMTRMLKAYLQSLFAWQRWRGRRLGVEHGQTGAITFIQRFNSSLGLFPHLHSIVPDGLFVPSDSTDAGQHLEFVALPPPDDDDITRLTSRIVRRLGAIALDRLNRAHDEPDWVPDEEAALRASTAEALRPPLPLPSTTPRGASPPSDDNYKPLCSRENGFSLHAARAVEPHDRSALERLCRYGLRAPFALHRFSLDPDDRVRYRLPKPRRDGSTEIVFEPVALLRRLAALIPAPYGNLVRYHGVFANRSRYRPMLPPPPSDTDQTSCSHAGADAPSAPDDIDVATAGMNEPTPRRRASWAQLLKRVIGVDALKCPRCSATMLVIAFITDPAIVRKILDHLGLPTHPRPLSPAQLPQQHELDFVDDLPPDDDYLDIQPHDHTPLTASRAPP